MIDLKQRFDEMAKELAKSLGCTMQTTPTSAKRNGTTTHSATISFVSGEKAKEMARFYLRKKEEK
jgi:hypothetical protein